MLFRKPRKIPVAFFGTVGVCLAAAVSCVVVAQHDHRAAEPPAQLRRPVAAAFVDDSRTLCVVNQRSGSVVLVDVEKGVVREEKTFGKHLNDLAVLPDRKHVLTVDDVRHELLVLSFDGTRLRMRTRLAVAPYPASVAVLPDGKRAIVGSLWSRRVQVVDLTPLSTASPDLRIVHTLRLPFAPRCQCVLPGSSQVVVADAFGGHLALVDAVNGRLIAAHKITGHNLRGLAVSADGQRLLIAHQILNEQAPVLEESIWRGLLMTNVVSSIPLGALQKSEENLDKARGVISLKGYGQGAGDPAGVTVLDREQFAVALAGVNEVALVGAEGDRVRRVLVGQRPTAVVAGARGQRVVVLNTFDDSLSVLDAKRGLVHCTITLGSQPVLSSADRGELLFFDARLSRDAWFSCHSCHTDGHTNGLLADTLGDGSHGTPKRTLTLRGTALTDPWAWNGSMKYLQDQIEKSLTDTMHAPSISGEQINDLLSFLHTLPPPPPLEPVSSNKSDREKVERGRKLFHSRGCVRCHIAPLTYSSHDLHDVGFADENGLRKLNSPSLRGVGQGARFLHDNRAATLEEVFTKYRHKVGLGLSAEERDDLLRFLRTL
ncbi:MAG TPA: cytochrome c peroxidase [Gemmataceae bacterium]|nr:cytochrome c peroxidase [Gemmataceae bacterium]